MASTVCQMGVLTPHQVLLVIRSRCVGREAVLHLGRTSHGSASPSADVISSSPHTLDEALTYRERRNHSSVPRRDAFAHLMF